MLNFILLQQLIFSILIRGDSNKPLGDVSLECPADSSTPLTGGYVTVYQPSVQQYVPVCLSGFNRAAAAAVCRQIGYVDAMPVFEGRSYYGAPSSEVFENRMLRCSATGNTLKYFISYVICPSVSNYIDEGEMNIMRCSVGPLTNSCSNDIVAVQCSSAQLHDFQEYIYNGQVYLHGSTDENFKGSLRIRLFDEYYYVCRNNFNEQAVDSICRQLGYTNGTHVASNTVSSNTRTHVMFTRFFCNANSGSFKCFSHCISNEYYRFNNDGCHGIDIDCDFQAANMLTHSAGNRDQCVISGSAKEIEVSIRLGIFTSILAVVLLYMY